MKSLAALRLVAATHAIAVCLQPVLAGVYLNGSGGALRIHEPLGLGVAFLCLGQLLVATICWRSGGRGLAATLALALLLGEGLQIGMGYSRQLALHIPLGIAIVATPVRSRSGRAARSRVPAPAAGGGGMTTKSAVEQKRTTAAGVAVVRCGSSCCCTPAWWWRSRSWPGTSCPARSTR